MSIERNAAIGANIKALIKQNGVDQKKLAKELAVSESAMSGYVKGKTSIPSWVVADIADYFHVSTDSLLSNQRSSADYTESPLGYLRNPSMYSPKAVLDCLDILLTCFLGNFELVEVTRTVPRFRQGTIEQSEEHFYSLLIRDDIIQWVLERWELYLRVVDEAIDSMDELKGALVDEFLKNALSVESDYYQLIGAHIISKYDAVVFANKRKPEERKVSESWFDLVEIAEHNKVFFLEEYVDKDGNEIGKQNRKLEFPIYSNWNLEDVDKQREILLKYHRFVKAQNEIIKEANGE